MLKKSISTEFVLFLRAFPTNNDLSIGCIQVLKESVKVKGGSSKLVPLLALTASVFHPAQATIIATGDAYVPSQVNFNQTVQVATSGSPLNGALEVNTSPTGNGYTSFTASALYIGTYGQNGTVGVKGNGVSGSAKININGNSGSGIRNNGTLEISNGGLVQSNENIYLGEGDPNPLGPPSTPVYTYIDGAGSILRAQQQSSGFSSGRIEVGFTGSSQSTVYVSGGGVMEAISKHAGDNSNDGSVWVGVSGEYGNYASVNISGAGSVMRASNYIGVGSDFRYSTSGLDVTSGGRVEVLDNAAYGGAEMFISSFAGSAVSSVRDAGSTLAAKEIQIGGSGLVVGFLANGTPVPTSDLNFGSLVVGQQVESTDNSLIFDRNGDPVLAVASGPDALPSTYQPGHEIYIKGTGSMVVENSALVTADTINVSNNKVGAQTFNNRNSVLTVRNGGIVTADVNVFKDGILNGNGTIVGNTTIDGGILAAGNSPGTLTFDGNLTLLSGALEIELGGANPGQFDVVHVLGDLTAANGFDVKLKFLSGFTPQEGQSFNFLDVDGSANIDFSLVNLILENSTGESNIHLDFNASNGSMSLITATVPVPMSIWLFSSGIIGLFGLKKRNFVI